MSATAETPTLDLRAYVLAGENEGVAQLMEEERVARAQSVARRESMRRADEVREEHYRWLNEQATARKVDALKRGELTVEEEPEPRREMPYDLYPHDYGWPRPFPGSIGHYPGGTGMAFGSASTPYPLLKPMRPSPFADSLP